MYEVIKAFVDLEDNERLYQIGDTYPAPGAVKPTADRIKGLMNGNNAARDVFLSEKEEPKKKGGKKSKPKKDEDEREELPGQTEMAPDGSVQDASEPKTED